MNHTTPKTSSLGWTTDQLITLSQTLEKAYGTGPLPADLPEAQAQGGDRGGWTTALLLKLSAAKCL